MKPLTPREIERYLKAGGFWLDRICGTHYIWENNAGRSVPVPHPGNRPVRQGTLLPICRKAGITPPSR